MRTPPKPAAGFLIGEAFVAKAVLFCRNLSAVFSANDSSDKAMSLIDLQKRLCRRFGADFLPSDELLKVGIGRDFDPERFPMNGLRHQPEGDTTGWYIWSGEEFSEAPGFFDPWHTKHVYDRYPYMAVCLGLAPGWRFSLAPGYEDFWFDANLLDI